VTQLRPICSFACGFMAGILMIQWMGVERMLIVSALTFIGRELCEGGLLRRSPAKPAPASDAVAKGSESL
jgi:hypothetical protein